VNVLQNATNSFAASDDTHANVLTPLTVAGKDPKFPAANIAPFLDWTNADSVSVNDLPHVITLSAVAGKRKVVSTFDI